MPSISPGLPGGEHPGRPTGYHYGMRNGKPGASLIGPILAAWIVLVVSGYLSFPGHTMKLALAIDGFRLWSKAYLSLEGILGELPHHLRGAAAVGAGLALAWLAGGAPLAWLSGTSAPIRLGLGLGLASLGLLGLGLVGLAFPALFFIGALVLAAAGWKIAGRGRLRAACPASGIPPSILPGWVSRFAVILAGSSLLLNMLGALAPETGYDSLIQHLADPRAYLAAHRIAFNDLSFLAQHPGGIEMLYMFLLPAGDDTAARLLHVALGALSAWAFFHWVRSTRSGSDALLLSSLIYLVPFTGILSARSYIDNGLIFYGTLALLAPAGTWVQGALIGLAIGAKYLGGFFLVGWMCALAAGGRFRGAARVFAAASLVAGVWGIRNILNTGNPVYPFGYSLLGGIGWDAHSDAEYHSELSSYAMVRGWAAHLAIPWSASVRDLGALDDGSLGPVFLALLPLALIFRATSLTGRMLFRNALVLGVLWLVSPRQVRYALGFLPYLLAMLVPAMARATASWPFARMAGTAMAVVVLPVQFLLSFSAVYLWVNPWYVAVGSVSRPYYLITSMEPRDTRSGRSLYMEAAGRFPAKLPPASRTYMMGDAKVYYFPGKFLVNALFNPPLFASVVRTSRTAEEVAKRLRQRGITHVLYNVGGSIHVEFTHKMYRWDRRELALLEDFYGKWMKKIDRLEDSSGDPMYILFDLSRGRYGDPEYLPGIDTRMGAVEGALAEGRRGDAIREARKLAKDYPESVFIRGWLRKQGLGVNNMSQIL